MGLGVAGINPRDNLQIRRWRRTREGDARNTLPVSMSVPQAKLKALAVRRSAARRRG
jgi:hypothetical protein